MEIDRLLIEGNSSDLPSSGNKLLYMHEEAVRNSSHYGMNFSLSAGDECVLNSVVTSSDLLNNDPLQTTMHVESQGQESYHKGVHTGQLYNSEAN